MATAKRAKVGERVTVEFGNVKGGKGKKVKKKYLSMGEETMKVLKLKQATNPTVKDKKGVQRTVRGEKGGKFIKIPVGKKSTTVNGKRTQVNKYRQIPVPAASTLAEITAFVKRLPGKPKHFISPGGRKISVASTGARR